MTNRADCRAGPVPLTGSTAFTDLRFTRDWIPGTEGRHGQFVTGTECNYLVAHGGRPPPWNGLSAWSPIWAYMPKSPHSNQPCGAWAQESAEL